MLRPKLNRIWTSANSVLRRDPGDAKYIQGWVSEIPTFQVLNYLQYKVDTTLLAQAERGIFEWGSDITYVLGSVVWCENDKKIYVSTVGSPDKTKAPNINLAHWSPSSIQVPRASYDAILAAIKAHIANKSNPHNLSAAQLGSYTKTETDALVAQYQALVLAHSSDKNNPHGLTALQVGAVPATGGTYTGDVTFNGGMYFDAGKVNRISKTDGLYLQAGTAVLGIDSTGAAVVGTTASKSKIVSEATFPTLKAAQEPSYAVPEPTIQMDLIGSINIRRGVGTASSDSSEPVYSAAKGNALDITPVLSKSMEVRSTESYALDNAKQTIAVDMFFAGPVTTSGQNPGVIGTERQSGSPSATLLLILRNTGLVYFERGYLSGVPGEVRVTNTISASMASLVGTWVRIVGVSDGNNIRLYFNGVLVNKQADATTTAFGVCDSVRVDKNGAADASEEIPRFIRNLRVWDSALTDKQVSTL